VDRDSCRLAFVDWLEPPVVNEVVQEAGDHNRGSCVAHL
jgi:hypothetical protein